MQRISIHQDISIEYLEIKLHLNTDRITEDLKVETEIITGISANLGMGQTVILVIIVCRDLQNGHYCFHRY